VPILTGSADAETELMTAHYDEHAPVLRRYVRQYT